MALSHTLPEEHNNFGIEIPNVYAKVEKVAINDRPVMAPPAEEGGEPTTVSKRTVVFTVHTYVSKERAEGGEGPVAAHTYTIPMNFDATTNLVAECYEWLKVNVPSLYATATDA